MKFNRQTDVTLYLMSLEEIKSSLEAVKARIHYTKFTASRPEKIRYIVQSQPNTS